ncbi:hypothetical protein J2X20_005827 [Pelomonas saccharophila]|uniref:Uncharacterized protein n=1 Tax=Roseateles saccharophilus TaxID=304 RepID=A0ABU1YWB6_ROSSA|nr:hypothetical protein [Roseateles saccharophilus]MDR7273142.1 hypothetical protein [Roseateles saccharophilus]
MQSKRFDERFVLEAELPTVDYTDKVDEIRLATLSRIPTGVSVWLRPIPVQQVHPGLRGMGSRRIRLNVMVADPEAAGAPERVRSAMHMDDDAELPF